MEAIHYSDRAAVAANQNKKEREYWLKQLAGDIVKTSFPADITLQEPGMRQMEKESFAFSPLLYSKVMKVTGGNNVKLHMALVTALVSLLHKYTDSRDILVGSPILKQEVEADFINRVLIFRNPLPDESSFKGLLQQVKDTILAAVENQNFPVEVLPHLLNMPESTKEFPLVDTMILLENIHDKSYIESIGYNMLFSFNRREDRIEGTVEYNSLAYRSAAVRQIVNHFTALLEKALQAPDIPLSRLDILSPEEKSRLLLEFNGSKMEFPQDKTFHRLFEEQVQKTPGNIAVIGIDSPGGAPARDKDNIEGPDEPASITGSRETAAAPRAQVLTYRQLNERSNRAARLLRRQGVTAETLVAIMVGRSVGMIVGVMAILKAGGAYLPIDPEYPAERIDFMLTDSQVRLLVTQQEFKEKINFAGSAVIIDNTGSSTQEQESDSGNLPGITGPGHLAYVIYTSGSTGKPKGVMLQHNHWINMAIGWRKEYRLQEMEINLLQMASFSFDVFAGDLARALVNGGKMVINPSLRADPDSLYRLIKVHRVSLFESTPSYIIPFMDHIHENHLKIDHLHLLILGSDSCPAREFKQLVSRYGKQIRIINSYGVTEATIDSSYYEESQAEKIPGSGNIPIGKPLPNVKFYILDTGSSKNLQPIGVTGELYIGGQSVARGYLNNPALTAEKFLKHMSYGFYNMSYGSYRSYIYRTGDLARWLPDGNVEFLGRTDQQVKVRGYRIELGEIENKLLEHDDIKEAVVVQKTDENNNNYLCGYFVSGKSIEAADLRDYLGQKLPDYMVPWFFVQMEQLPLSPNGKILRKALPDPASHQEAPYVAPRDETEKKLADIWTRVLAVEKEAIGIDTIFFDLAGNSLKAIIMAARIHKEFNVKIAMTDIFKLQTIRKLSQLIHSAAEDRYIPLQKAAVKDYYRLSSPQKRLYILQQADAASTSYNIPLMTILEGNPRIDKLEQAFCQLIRRHESLRTSFQLIDGVPWQKVHDEAKFEIEYDVSEEVEVEEERSSRFEGTRGFAPLPGEPATSRSQPAAALISSFVRPFDLSRAPLLRAGLIKVEEQKTIFMLDIHHIIADGISTGILIKELMALYQGVPLPELRLQYKDFSEWQNSEQQRKVIEKQGEYWLEVFQGEIPKLDLPIDYERPMNRSFAGASRGFQIPGQESRALRNLAAEQEATLFMIVLALFNILLAKTSGQEDIVIGTPVAGRSHPDVEHVIGMFLNTLALRNYPEAQKTFREFFREIKTRTLQAFENQAYQFEDLVDRVISTRDPGRNPLFDVMLMFQGQGEMPQEIPTVEIPGLKLKPYPQENKTSKFDLTLWAFELEPAGTLSFAFEYCTKLFKQETIEILIDSFKAIISAVLADPDTPISEIEITSAAEQTGELSQLTDDLTRE